MKFTAILSTLMMILPQLATAEVDLLTGAFEFRIPQTQIHYSSRRTDLSKIGFGWCIQKDGSCQGAKPSALGTMKFRNGDLIEFAIGRAKWAFEYDELHNLTEIRSPLGDVTRISYSGALDRVASVIQPDGCLEKFDYSEEFFRVRLLARRTCDELSEETIKLMAEYFPSRKQVRRIQWSKSARRQKSISQNSGGLLYDDTGRLLQRQDNQERFTYIYDDFGVIREILRESLRPDGAPISERTAFEFDDKMRLKRIVTPEKKEIDFSYNNSGRLQGLNSANEDTLAVALALQAALDKLSPIEGGLAL
jgi:YD repeat-containing protein